MPVDDSDDLLETGRPLPRWLRVLAVAVAVVGLGFVGVHALTTHGSQQPVAAPGSSSSTRTAPPLLRFPGGGPKMVRAAGCGPDLPPVQVSASPGGRSTHLLLLVGGRTLQRVDFDSGHAVPVRTRPALLPTEWFGYLTRAAGTTYATVSAAPCEVVANRVLAVRGDRTVITSLGPSAQVVADESSAWEVRDPPHVLSALPRGRQVELPAGFVPVAATHARIVGYLVEAMDPEEIVTVDARSGRIGSPTGAFGSVVAAGHGRIYWVQRPHSNEVHSAGAGGGAERTYRLPAEPVEAPGAISPDGRFLALVIRRATPDSRSGADRLDGRIALLDLRSGRLQVVPGIALASSYRPTVTFAPGGWLVIGYEQAGVEGLAAWRPGLPTAIRSPFRGAASPAAPPIVPAG